MGNANFWDPTKAELRQTGSDNAHGHMELGKNYPKAKPLHYGVLHYMPLKQESIVS